MRGSDVRTEKRAGSSISHRQGRGRNFLTTKQGIGVARKFLRKEVYTLQRKGRTCDRSARYMQGEQFCSNIFVSATDTDCIKPTEEQPVTKNSSGKWIILLEYTSQLSEYVSTISCHT